MGIDVHVTGGGTISNGELRADSAAVARCTLCAREVDASDIEQTRLVAHVNGRQPTLRWVRSTGTDVTAEMQAAWTCLNETPT